MHRLCRWPPLLAAACYYCPPRFFSLAAPTTGTGNAIITRERADYEQLTLDAFGAGNQHLKRVTFLEALPEMSVSYPEVCFIGHTNTGKSKMIQALLCNPRMGRPGVKPGHQSYGLNFFCVGDAFYIVDTQGWGRYASEKPFQTHREMALTKQYIALKKNTSLQRVYWFFSIPDLAVRGRLRPREDDIEAFLRAERVPFTAVLTKYDVFDTRELKEDRKRKRRGIATDALDSSSEEPTPEWQGAWSAADTKRTVTTTTERREENLRRAVEILQSRFSENLSILVASGQTNEGVDELRHDIVYQCSQPIPLTRPLSLENLSHLSFLPPTAAEKTAVELKYAARAQVLPPDHMTIETYNRELRLEMMPDQSAVTPAIEEATIALVQKRDIIDMNVSLDAISASEPLPETTVPPPTPQSEGSARAAADRSSRSLFKPLPAAESSCLTPAFSVQSSKSAALFGSTAVAEAFGGSAPLPPTKQAVVPTPAVMIKEVMGQSEYGVERSAKRAVDTLSALYNPQERSVSDLLFIEQRRRPAAQFQQGPDDRDPVSGLVMERAASHRELRTKALHKKYVEHANAKRERPIHLDARGFMHPWVAEAERVRPTLRLGSLDVNRSPRRMIWGLKQKGVQGRQHTANTLKGVGKATTKLQAWAR